MKRVYLIEGLLLLTVLPVCAQTEIHSDSFRVLPMPGMEDDAKADFDVSKSTELNSVPFPLQMSVEKPWMDFDTTLPDLFKQEEKKVVLTLRPYSANTRYDWDPIYQKKIVVNKDTWRGEKFYHLYKSLIPSNWAKHPFDKGIRGSSEEIEATGLRYTARAGARNMTAGIWERVTAPSGMDLMTPFTKDFWNPKARKRRERTLEVLRSYGEPLIRNTE